MSRRTLASVLVVLALVAGAGSLLYAFGAPQQNQVPDSVAAPPAETGGTDGKPSMGDVPVQVPDEVPAPDPSVPLAIEIPGCRCHSDDPKLVKQHEAYRMNQCAGCHAGRTPTGQ